MLRHSQAPKRHAIAATPDLIPGKSNLLLPKLGDSRHRDMESQARPETLRRAASHPPYGRSKLGVPQAPTLVLFPTIPPLPEWTPAKRVCVCVGGKKGASGSIPI